jgi:hypothetical protein
MPTTPTFPQPQNAAEAEAAEKAVATFYLGRVQACVDVMAGPEAQAFAAKVAELLLDGLPNGTSAAVNMPSVAKWFVDVRTGLDADLARLNAIVNPPSPEEPVVPGEPEA